MIHVQPEIAQSAVMQELEQSTLYNLLDARANIYIKRGDGDTNVSVKKTHNREAFLAALPENLRNEDIEYIVNINSADFENEGLDIDENRAYSTLGSRSPAPSFEMAVAHFLERMEVYNAYPGPNQTIPFFDLAKSMQGLSPLEPFKKPTLTESMERLMLPGEETYTSAGNKLSLFTVILHELGHIEQNLRTPRLYHGAGLEEITYEDIPPLPENLVAKVTAAYNDRVLWAPVWTELVDMINTMQEWIGPFRDHDEDSRQGDYVERVNQLETLGNTITNKAMVWIEYDNITHTEHPEAKRRREPIRHIHGAEMKLNPENQQSVIDRLVLENEAETPTGLGDVANTMAANAHRLTAGVIAEAAQYVQLYQELRDSLH